MFEALETDIMIAFGNIHLVFVYILGNALLPFLTGNVTAGGRKKRLLHRQLHHHLVQFVQMDPTTDGHCKHGPSSAKTRHVNTLWQSVADCFVRDDLHQLLRAAAAHIHSLTRVSPRTFPATSLLLAAFMTFLVHLLLNSLYDHDVLLVLKDQKHKLYL